MKKDNQSNLLTFVPVQNIEWQEDPSSGRIRLVKPKFENAFLKRNLLPRLKQPNYKINLDEYGSMVWRLIDGKSSVMQIALKLKENYGERVEPVYERVGKFMQSLERNKFITYRS
jgi:hypothetical protein